MARVPANLPIIQAHAQQFLDAIGVKEPPLDADACLVERGLRIDECSLDELLELRADGLYVPPRSKIQAVLDLGGRRIWLKEGLHHHQEKFGKLHEVGHELLPWQEIMLRYCTILEMPRAVQDEWEREASLFAAECLFLGGRFMEEALSYPLGLRTPKELADRYEVSYEAAFRHYVEGHPKPCVLLVSKRVERVYAAGELQEFKVLYYVPSPTFPGGIPPGWLFRSTAVEQLFSSTVDQDGDSFVIRLAPEFVDHHLVDKGTDRTYFCQSFQNTYKVFTLLSREPFG